jgi:hypothetical protein
MHYVNEFLKSCWLRCFINREGAAYLEQLPAIGRRLQVAAKRQASIQFNVFKYCGDLVISLSPAIILLNHSPLTKALWSQVAS